MRHGSLRMTEGVYTRANNSRLSKKINKTVYFDDDSDPDDPILSSTMTPISPAILTGFEVGGGGSNPLTPTLPLRRSLKKLSENKDLKPGDMIQIWDWQVNKSVATRLELHGKIGYVIKDQPNGSPPGLLWEILQFDGDPPSKQNIKCDG